MPAPDGGLEFLAGHLAMTCANILSVAAGVSAEAQGAAWRALTIYFYPCYLFLLLLRRARGAPGKRISATYMH